MYLSSGCVILDLVYVVQGPDLIPLLWRWTFYPGLAIPVHSDWFEIGHVEQIGICLIQFLKHFGNRSSDFVGVAKLELLVAIPPIYGSNHLKIKTTQRKLRLREGERDS